MSTIPKAELFVDSSEVKLSLVGAWTLERAAEAHAACSNILSQLSGAVPRVVIDGAGLTRLDTAGAFLLIDMLFAGIKKPELKLSNFAKDYERILSLVAERWRPAAKSVAGKSSIFALIGRIIFLFIGEARHNIAFIGAVSAELTAALLRPRLFRMREFIVQLELSCIRSLPVIMLVNGLIGMVIAYIFASQAQRYGASIFIVDGVVMAMSREMAPMIVAIVMAGRSGSAFTAQLGSMKVSQELDAIQMLGLSLLQVLVIPRVIALALAMPLLVVVGDCVGIFGGMLIAQNELDLSFSVFLDRMQDRIPIRHFVLGLIKAPVFAIFVALIGCRMGLNVKPDTRSVGLATTSTVVQSIVAVIILDALFAVLFMELGL